MPARIFLAIAAFLFAGTGAQQPPVDIDPPLWVVRDADTTVYLFGSIHWLKPGLGWFDDAVRDAFDSSDMLVLETVSVDAATARRVQDKVGTLADGPSLPDRLPAEYRPKLAAAIAEQGYPAGAFDRTKPWLAATTLSTLPLRRAGYDPTLGVETVLTNAAQAAGKPVTGLEERAQQLGYFDALSQEAQIAMLKVQLDGMDRATTSTDEVLAAWGRGDVAAMGRIVSRDQHASSAAFTESVITKRNRRWAGWIVERMRRPGVVFMAVGVGHLTGGDTVQRELARLGIPVERVRY
ncbi:TraB/GumN family protein [Sphingomonas qomolangmaensis]|uniref:TraB/GumN family protein n=1 Tax=Sphingomonas qomolangmaensis TaxID=2918765 RepID=A0ABY5L372_9SPHN|nr:TraB/GumN family protein [Sphingomonas qomolangmaensis]UUL81403.1 TraB/GumN family protein [Sphingomonas qomolangmaensis]